MRKAGEHGSLTWSLRSNPRPTESLRGIAKLDNEERQRRALGRLPPARIPERRARPEFSSYPALLDGEAAVLECPRHHACPQSNGASIRLWYGSDTEQRMKT